MIPPGRLLQTESRRSIAVEGPVINMHLGVQALRMWLEGGYGLPREERFRFIILYVGSGFMRCHHEQGRQSLLPCWWLNLRVYAVIWLLKLGRRLVMGSATEQHRGSGVPAETCPHCCFGEGETQLWICKTNMMNCSKCLFPNNSNTRHVHVADLWHG